MKIINFEKKKMIPLKTNSRNHMKRQNMLHLQKKLEHKYNNDKNMVELEPLSLY